MISVLSSSSLAKADDGAPWIWNVCGEGFAGWNVAFILDLFHALEDAVVAVRALTPDKGEQGVHELDQGAVRRQPGRLGHHHSEVVVVCIGTARPAGAECAATYTGSANCRSDPAS